ASTMGELRNALRAYALDGLSPGAVLTKLDHLVRRLQEDQMTTLTYAVIDPDWTQLRFASAGHLPPLLLGCEGSAEFLWDGRATPLGVRTDGEYAEGTLQLDGGSTVLLYTDGLVEVPGEDLLAGLERLRQVVMAGPAEPEALCDHLVGSMVGSDPTRDDVALLAFRTIALPRELLRLDLPTDRSSVRYARRALGRWLEQAGASRKDVWEVQLATHEAFANAIEHAYRFGEALVQLEARLADGEVVLTISDTGGWRNPVEGDRGKGIALMRGLMDRVSVEGGDGGTRVELRRRLSGAGGLAKPTVPLRG
ncbi:MAG: SpoIIE family protein phosphatase, partial [Thermoleophilaceae bacterium]